MTAPKVWILGARPRTLPAAIAPVLAGTGAAAFDGAVVWWKAALALGVALALQIGVNYANDYSDGVRGTDDVRVGPLRLVGSGSASPEAVKRAAIGFLALGAVFGLVLAATTSWWLVGIGALALVAAWTYTGGPKPYGYLALGELSVFVFFGLVAVVGTTYVQIEQITLPSVAAGVAVGALACAILVANNLRDVETDAASGKRTLAVHLGDARTRYLFLGLGTVAALGIGVCVASAAMALLGFIGLPLWLRAAVPVASGAKGPALIPVLQAAGLAELATALGLAVGLAL